MFDLEKKTKDVGIYAYDNGKYRDIEYGIAISVQEILKEAEHRTWLIIEVLG